MPQGLQCWDANGNMALDTTDRLTRVLGEFDTGTSDGSMYDEYVLTGTPWYIISKTQNEEWIIESSIVLSVSNGTIKWNFKDYKNSIRCNTHIIYGVY